MKLTHLVSKSKRRYIEDGFDLDLSYITPNIIAMGFPAQNFERVYRNDISQVKKFLKKKHEGHYRIYNLCGERYYDPSRFNYLVEHYPFNDHSAPPLALLISCCLSVSKYLSQHPSNTAVIHCKAGKGRTGVVICCLMMYLGIFDNPYDSLRKYAEMRTFNRKGVTIPCQERYVHYFHKLLEAQKYDIQSYNYEPCEIAIHSVLLYLLPYGKYTTTDFHIDVFYEYGLQSSCNFRRILKSRTSVFLELLTPMIVFGDFMLTIYTKDGNKKKLLSVSCNTIFNNKDYQIDEEFCQKYLDTLPQEVDDDLGFCLWRSGRAWTEIRKKYLNGPHKDRQHKKFPENFRMFYCFSMLNNPAEKHVDVAVEDTTEKETRFRRTQSMVKMTKTEPGSSILTRKPSLSYRKLNQDYVVIASYDETDISFENATPVKSRNLILKSDTKVKPDD